MRILFDTNILILRENNSPVPENLSNLMSLLNGLEQCSLHVHALSIQEIKHDLNITRRDTNLSKISSYALLNEYPDYKSDSDFKSKIPSPKTDNDIVDNQLLYCVYKNVVDYLITEDRELLRKGELLSINTVININEAISIFVQYYPKTDFNLIQNFKKIKAFALPIQDSFFDSLKNEYKEFNVWFKKIANRECYAYLDDKERINALLIPKIENKSELSFSFNSKGVSDKILKICLFKVSSRAQGLKLGERLLKIAFDYADANKLNDIYLTHFCSEGDYLVSLIESFGFYKKCENNRGEAVFVKHIVKQELDNIIDYAELNKKYYPSFCSNIYIKKHIVPIKGTFHDLLFPDWKNPEGYQTSLQFELTKSEGNSIKKAYICNANTTKIKSNDILLFYRTEDEKCITTLGVVDDVIYDVKDPDEVCKLTSKRTVFEHNQIEELCHSKVLVILFKQHFYLKAPYSYKNLLKNNIVTGPIQSIMEINDDKYQKIVQGNIDAHFIIN